MNEKGGGLLTCGATKVRLSAMAATVNLAPGCSCGRVAVGRWSMLSIGQVRSWREPGLERERERGCESKREVVREGVRDPCCRLGTCYVERELQKAGNCWRLQHTLPVGIPYGS